MKETVARFLSKLELEPVILHEQPNRGRTIIEKFEDHSDVSFAIVLFTPDDVGFPANKSGDAKPRARQNVVLELGFFMAALGRDRVCVLYKSDVEVPSDYAGVLYQPLDDSGAWRLHIAREIKAAGIEVDLKGQLSWVFGGRRIERVMVFPSITIVIDARSKSLGLSDTVASPTRVRVTADGSNSGREQFEPWMQKSGPEVR